jgi:hypothetical protein
MKGREMFFQLSVGISELFIIEGPIPFKVTTDGSEVKINIRAVTSDEPDYSHLHYSVVCEATAEIKASKMAQPIVDAIWQKKLPQGFDVNKLPEAKHQVLIFHYMPLYTLGLSRAQRIKGISSRELVRIGSYITD